MTEDRHVRRSRPHTSKLPGDLYWYDLPDDDVEPEPSALRRCLRRWWP
ncbi:hypothetical protein [Nonomuraea aridisoli]|nr:hypothetical protein [Nonomuraea aridisoli]